MRRRGVSSTLKQQAGRPNNTLCTPYTMQAEAQHVAQVLQAQWGSRRVLSPHLRAKLL